MSFNGTAYSTMRCKYMKNSQNFKIKIGYYIFIVSFRVEPQAESRNLKKQTQQLDFSTAQRKRRFARNDTEAFV